MMEIEQIKARNEGLCEKNDKLAFETEDLHEQLADAPSLSPHAISAEVLAMLDSALPGWPVKHWRDRAAAGELNQVNRARQTIGWNRDPEGFRWLPLNNLRIALGHLPDVELAKIASLSGTEILAPVSRTTPLTMTTSTKGGTPWVST